ELRRLVRIVTTHARSAIQTGPRDLPHGGHQSCVLVVTARRERRTRSRTAQRAWASLRPRTPGTSLHWFLIPSSLSHLQRRSRDHPSVGLRVPCPTTRFWRDVSHRTAAGCSGRCAASRS